MTALLRLIRPDDQDFLFKLYASTRLHEIAGFGWPDAQQEMFLRMQFNAQQSWYASMYAQSDHKIVEQNGEAIGRLMVLREKDSVLLIDVALLPEYRGQGIGGELISDLIQQCRREAVPLKLQVLRTNPALRLYERLGFLRTGEDQMYIQMECGPG